jgi:hypothetical protein
VALLCEAWLLATPQPQRPFIAPTGAAISSVLAAYAGGDDLAVSRWIPSIGYWGLASLKEVEQILDASPAPNRTKAAFVLEIIAGGRDAVRHSFHELGLSWLGKGAKPLGTEPATDRFEVLWHQTAIAAAQGQLRFPTQQAFLDAIQPRFEDARRRGVEPPNRFPLARAIAAAGLCCWDPREQAAMTSSGGFVMAFGPVQHTGSREYAVVLFEKAAELEPLRAEALVRGALLLHQGGHDRKAAEWLERVPPHDDLVLGYVQHLTHGRVLDALDRPLDAAAAYRRALETVPGTQTAGIGLAAALLRAGQVDEAMTAAAAARRPAASEAPRLTFHLADSRFIPQWLSEIRRQRLR